MEELTVISRARKLVGHLITAPVDVIALASQHGMDVVERALPPGQAGNTVALGDKVFLVINEADNPARRRFTVLHEMAHHLLGLPSKHGDRLPSNELERFQGRPPEERLCDTFAAECLVPHHLLKPLISNTSFSVNVLHELCDHFHASRQCIASAYVRASRELVAYVYSEQGRIQNILPSATLRQAGIFIQSGRLPDNSAGTLALKNRTIFETAEMDASDWSFNDVALSYSCYEEACHMPTHGVTLSLLTFEAALARPDIQHASEILEEDSLLEELTGHLQFHKR